MDWRLSNSDSDFDAWHRCVKCRVPYQTPKTLPCLHTVCLKCLKHHNDISLHKFQLLFPDQDVKTYVMPCPVCSFPCRLPNGPDAEPTNDWLIKIVYHERKLWWKEYYMLQAEQLKSTECSTRKQGKEDKKHKDKKTRNSPENGETSTVERKLDMPEEIDEENRTEVTPDLDEEARAESIAEEVAEAGLSNAPNGNFLFSWEEKLDADIRATVRQNLIDHKHNLDKNCLQPLDPEGPPEPGSGFLRHLFNFNLSHGSKENQCLRPNALAVNPVTGKVMVAGSSLNKIIFYSPDGKMLADKHFPHPVVACSFKMDDGELVPERFVAMGIVKKQSNAYALRYQGPVNWNPEAFHVNKIDNISSVTGFLLVDNIPFVSLGYENKSIWQCDGRRYQEICNPKVLNYPTHIAKGIDDTIIISDTGNHRVVVFSGFNYDNKRFIGHQGHDDGEFFWPLGIAVDWRGRLYVCDANNYRLQVFNPDFVYESTPLKKTFRLSPSVSQDVKPIDCAIDQNQQLLVLLRGRSYTSLQCFAYEHPAWCFYATEEPARSWNCFCCCASNAKNRSDYQKI